MLVIRVPHNIGVVLDVGIPRLLRKRLGMAFCSDDIAHLLSQTGNPNVDACAIAKGSNQKQAA